MFLRWGANLHRHVNAVAGDAHVTARDTGLARCGLLWLPADENVAVQLGVDCGRLPSHGLALSSMFSPQHV